MITLDGPNRLVMLSESNSFTAFELYTACKQWDALPENIQFPCPMDAIGMEMLGPGIYTDAIFRLRNGWKLHPMFTGSLQVNITVKGTIITDDGTPRVMIDEHFNNVTWIFEVTTAGTIITTGGSGSGSGASFDTILQELNAGDLSSAPSANKALMLLYMMARNQLITKNNQISICDNAGAEIAQASITDDGTTLTRSKFV